MVECAGLEIRYTVLRIEGSNPSFSARNPYFMRPSGRFSFHTPNYIPLRHVVWPPRVSNAIGSGGLAPSRLRTYCTLNLLQICRRLGLAPSRLRTYCTIGASRKIFRLGLAPSRLRTYFTVSERVEIGKALEGELAAKALQRMKSGIENPEENFPQGRAPQTRDLAAKAAGFGNGKTYATRLHSNSISRLALLTLAIDSIS